MAARYGLLDHPQHNGIKVEKFTLITLQHPARAGHYHSTMGSGGDTFINAVEQKDRVKEYHEQVNMKRRMIQ